MRPHKLPRVLFCIVLVLASIAPGIANASDSAGAAESLAEADGSWSLQTLAQTLIAGTTRDDARVSRLGNGGTKISVPLAERIRLAPKAAAKSLQTLAITVDLFVPDLFADTVRFDLAPITGFGDYYWGWVVVNVGEEDVEARSTIQRKGPGPDFKVTDTVTYDADSMTLVFYERPVGDPGMHTVKVNVSGAKKLVSRVCIECVPSSE